MSPEPQRTGPVLALCGGIGGAKLALGLYKHLAPGALGVAVNTGDDFEHLGLHISPDIDTVLYTLSGTENPETGWGRAEETWTFMAALEALLVTPVAGTTTTSGSTAATGCAATGATMSSMAAPAAIGSMAGSATMCWSGTAPM